MTGRINQIATDAVSVLLVVLLPVSGLPRRAPRSVCWCVCIGTSCAGCLRCLEATGVKLSRPELRRLLSSGVCSVRCASAVERLLQAPSRGVRAVARRSTSCCLHAVSTYMFFCRRPCTIAAGCKVPGDARPPCARGRVDVVLWSKWGWEGLFVDFF